MYPYATRQSKSKNAKAIPLPKFWQPKVTPDQQLTAKLYHWDLVDKFIKGEAQEEDMWDWIETGFTYSNLMRFLIEDGEQILDVSKAALIEQIKIYTSVLQRFHKTARVGFNCQQIQIARDAACAMDGLIGMDRFGFARKAALLSIEQVSFMKQLAAPDTTKPPIDEAELLLE